MSVSKYPVTVNEEYAPGKFRKKKVHKWLARVRVLDEKGVMQDKSKGGFDNPNDAKLYAAQARSEIKLGDAGKKLKKNKLMGETKLWQLIQQRIQDLILHKERVLRKDPIEKGADIVSMLQRMLKTEPTLINKTLGELDKGVFDDYRRRMIDEGKEDSSVNRYLSPIRKMLHIAKDGELGGSFKGVYFDLDPTMIRFVKETNRREMWLESLEEDQQIYDAINAGGPGCETILLQRRWLTYVVLALSTGLRRGVMLHLKWEDVHLDDKLIRIKEEYRDPKKPAPPFVPISKNLEFHIDAYLDQLPDSMKKPTDRLFPYSKGGFKTCWGRIIERTNLIKGETKEGNPQYFSPHGFRHTAETRYDDPPYDMPAKKRGYLLGHRNLDEGDKMTNTQKGYNHMTLKRHKAMCDEIRGYIDTGDAILAKEFKKQGKRRPDLQASIDISDSARRAYVAKERVKFKNVDIPEQVREDAKQFAELINETGRGLDLYDVEKAQARFQEEFDKLSDEEKIKVFDKIEWFRDLLNSGQVQPAMERKPPRARVPKRKLKPRDPNFTLGE